MAGIVGAGGGGGGEEGGGEKGGYSEAGGRYCEGVAEEEGFKQREEEEVVAAGGDEARADAPPRWEFVTVRLRRLRRGRQWNRQRAKRFTFGGEWWDQRLVTRRF
jgi:hypothetical protein